MQIGTAVGLKNPRSCGFESRPVHQPFFRFQFSFGVAIAQSVEPWIVIPRVLGSIPSGHPKSEFAAIAQRIERSPPTRCAQVRILLAAPMKALAGCKLLTKAKP